MQQIITTKKPIIPVGFKKCRYSTGGFSLNVIGTKVECDTPVWAERRYDKNSSIDKVYLKLFTYWKK